MNKDGRQFIKYFGISYQCIFAGYINPVQHKWLFIIEGTDNDFSTPNIVEFLNTEMVICSTLRKDGKTNITAWVL